MSLPFDYTGKFDVKIIHTEASSEILPKMYQFLAQSNQIKHLKLDNNRLGFVFKSLFTIPYEVEIFFPSKNEPTPEFKIKLTHLIQVCIALALFIALFSKLRISGYLWFSSIFLIIFYFFNLVFTEKLLAKQVESFPLFYNENKTHEGKFSEEQLNWLKDPEKCPACGEEITEYYLKCPECGLKLRGNAKLSPMNVTGYKTKRFKYIYRERKKNKNET
ncbi:MAG: hypothetical protein U0W24_07660 [Bacteroidales bacterium]